MNFKHCDRKQMYLFPPSLEDWLPEGHLARFIAELIEKTDLSVFERAYNETGAGGKAYPPAVLIGVLLYSYSLGEHSSRQIEKLCVENIGVRYLAVNQFLDHSTISRFRVRHEKHLEVIFVETLRRCQRLGIVKVGVLALDGTKIKANASMAANRTGDGLEKEVRRMLAEAAAKDRDEDEKHGKDGKEEDLPKGLQSRQARLEKISELQRQMEEEKAAARAKQAEKIKAREAEEATSGRKKRGRKPTAPDKIEQDEAKVNLTDPDSRIMKTQAGFVQGYNAQAVVTADQIIIAAELTQEANDQKQLVPMLAAAEASLASVSGDGSFGVALVDAGYPNEAALAATEERGWDVLAATKKEWKERKAAREMPSPRGRIPQNATRMQRMARRMQTKRGREQYRMRGQTVEPVFGQLKHNLRHNRFSRRGFSACRSEWFLICGAHNLLKLWRAGKAERN